MNFFVYNYIFFVITETVKYWKKITIGYQNWLKCERYPTLDGYKNGDPLRSAEATGKGELALIMPCKPIL